MALAAVFQIGSLGDSLLSIPAIRSLRDLLSDVDDYLLVTRLDSGQKVSPRQVFDMVWPCRYHASYLGDGPVLPKMVSLARLIWTLRRFQPKYAVYLMPAARTQQQVDRDKVFLRIAGIKNLLGFRALSPDELGAGRNMAVERTEAFLRLRRLWDGRAAERFAEAAQTPLIVPPVAAVAYVRAWLAANRRFAERRLVAFAPFSNWQSKDLPQSVIAEVAVSLERDLGVEVIFLGGAKDRAPVDEIHALTNSGISACGIFSVDQSAALLLECALLIGADSGPMHLAGALGVPAVAVFSRVAQELVRWFPMGGKHSILYRDIACAGCDQTRCPLLGHPCIGEISADDILQAAGARLHGLIPIMGSGSRAIAHLWDVPALAQTLAQASVLREESESNPVA